MGRDERAVGAFALEHGLALADDHDGSEPDGPGPSQFTTAAAHEVPGSPMSGTWLRAYSYWHDHVRLSLVPPVLLFRGWPDETDRAVRALVTAGIAHDRAEKLVSGIDGYILVVCELFVAKEDADAGRTALRVNSLRPASI